MFNWERVESRRQSWEPNDPKPMSESVAPEVAQCLSRCLALTELEPAVAIFVREGLDRGDKNKIGSDAINTLELNILDEEKHEIALNRAKLATINYQPEHETEAKVVVQAWKDLSDNPIVTTAVLEQSCFMLMLVLYSRFGGGSMRITSNDISSDEQRHAASNRAVSMLLGVKPSKAMLKLREDTVAWFSEGLDYQGFTQERMLRNSLKLLKAGKTDFTETAEGIVYAPFEISGGQKSAYA